MCVYARWLFCIALQGGPSYLNICRPIAAITDRIWSWWNILRPPRRGPTIRLNLPACSRLVSYEAESETRCSILGCVWDRGLGGSKIYFKKRTWWILVILDPNTPSLFLLLFLFLSFFCPCFLLLNVCCNIKQQYLLHIWQWCKNVQIAAVCLCLIV